MSKFEYQYPEWVDKITQLVLYMIPECSSEELIQLCRFTPLFLPDNTSLLQMIEKQVAKRIENGEINEALYLASGVSQIGIHNPKFLTEIEKKLLGENPAKVTDFEETEFMKLKNRGYSGLTGLIYKYNKSSDLVRGIKYLCQNKKEKLDFHNFLSFLYLLVDDPD